MTLIFPSAITCFYIIVFYLKYIPGNIFLLAYAAGLPEMLLMGLAAPLLRKVGVNKAFMIGFIAASLGGAGILAIGP